MRIKTAKALYLAENLDLPEATGVEGATWEPFQKVLLNDASRFSIDDKARQIAWSFTVAAEAVAEAHLDSRSSIFTSFNLDEAREKVRYAKAVHHALHPLAGGAPVCKPKLLSDTTLGMEFDNGARIISLPNRPPRGKARFNVYLDEFAHVGDDKAIYAAALPIISKGGRLRIGSTPLGAGGMFWEVFKEELRTYPGYTRGFLPWWKVGAFCTDLRAAAAESRLTTAERVERFGAETLKAIFENMPLEDFQQEYAGEFVDETTAWITWDEIKANQDDLKCYTAEARGADIASLFRAIEGLAKFCPESAYGAGVDVGRTRDKSEVFAVGLSSTGQYPLRLALTLDAMPFPEQEAVITRVLETLPITALLIDRNGLGRNLAETMETKFPGKAEGVDFTNATKALMASDAKMLIQKHKTPLPRDREIGYQIHSIKKRVSANKNNIFDAGRNEKHHADKFWAWALALQAAKREPDTFNIGWV